MTHCSRLKKYHTFVIIKCKWGRGAESKGQRPEVRCQMSDVRCQMSECSIGGHSFRTYKNHLKYLADIFHKMKISATSKTLDKSDYVASMPNHLKLL